MTNKIPYECTGCHTKNVKLWRNYQITADNAGLLCASCALKDQGAEGPIDSAGLRLGKYGRTDQIGSMVPAVPADDGRTFWGYGSVPQVELLWWRSLPNDVTKFAKQDKWDEVRKRHNWDEDAAIKEVVTNLRKLADHLERGGYPMIFGCDVPDISVAKKEGLMCSFSITLSKLWPG